MKVLIALAALVAVATCWSIPSEQELANHWYKFKAAHGKTYASPVEETHRMKIFKENAINIAKHNARFDAGEVSFTVAINKFADMHAHEVFERLNGFRPDMVKRGVRPVHNVTSHVSELPKTVDWRSEGYVTDVKDQGQCGSCWSFSTTGSLEGALFKKTGQLVSLSEQNLVDCSTSYGNEGCNGGLMDSAFQYIIDNGGIDTEASYPYTGYDGSCRFTKENVGGSAVGFVDIKQGSEADLQDAIANVGPVSVAIDANHFTFQFYHSGIFHWPFCSSKNLDHGVLAVGYGSNGKNKDYWIVKNSWGTSWGEKGYIKMARNRKNHCGIATMASYPTV